ncbi:Smr/MutS family protein [Gillisia marina]|uniref:Smr/MutS family protein n=1 Tax=Gillisia marina TaxID=1167637 RepID=UPI00029B4167|nr:Smr/MutS family protein [Gillisia marina]
MKFQVNDKVEVLDDALEGKVINIDGAIIYVETSEGFLMEFDASELVKIEEEQSSMIASENISISQIIKEKQPTKRIKAEKVKSKDRSAPPMEVDLHIEKLVNSFRGMSNFDILNIQLDTAKRQINFAISKRIPKIVFIHGVGEGVLKAELDYLLSRYDNLKFYDANFQKYGLGATEVYIYQNS